MYIYIYTIYDTKLPVTFWGRSSNHPSPGTGCFGWRGCGGHRLTAGTAVGCFQLLWLQFPGIWTRRKAWGALWWKGRGIATLTLCGKTVKPGMINPFIAHMMQPQPRLVAAICPGLETTHQLPSTFDSHDDVASFDMCRYANRGWMWWVSLNRRDVMMEHICESFPAASFPADCNLHLISLYLTYCWSNCKPKPGPSRTASEQAKQILPLFTISGKCDQHG